MLSKQISGSANRLTSIGLSKMVQFQVYKDGLQIDKATGKDFYCIGDADWELAGACLDAATKSLR